MAGKGKKASKAKDEVEETEEEETEEENEEEADEDDEEDAPDETGDIVVLDANGKKIAKFSKYEAAENYVKTHGGRIEKPKKKDK